MSELRGKILESFPALKTADSLVTDDFFQNGKYLEIPHSEFISFEGNQCRNLAILLSGRARVYKLGENGREITLYRIGKGESCILTASCILSEKEFPAFAVAETDIEAFVIPSEIFLDWVGKHKFWQKYVFELVSKRLSAIIAVVEEVAFKRVDERIANYLLQTGRRVIHQTHQEIAVEIGTSREVVSRILKDFEHEGIVSLARGEIKIENFTILEKKIKHF